MVWAAMMGMALGLQPPAPAREIAYVPVRGEHAALMGEIERALPDLAPPGVAIRRANLDTARFEACLTGLRTVHTANPCLRALVPAPGRRGSVIALRIGMQAISNVTGSRVHYRHELFCIGQRSIATAALGDDDDRAGRFDRNSAAAIRACLVSAMSPRNAAALGRDPRTGAPLWRVALDRHLPDNAAHARGRGSEQALVDVQQVRRRPGPGGRCFLRLRVGEVEGYFFLRRGDLIEVAAPCTGDARAGFERALAPPPIRRGSRGRIYLDYDGEVLFLEAL